MGVNLPPHLAALVGRLRRAASGLAVEDRATVRGEVSVYVHDAAALREAAQARGLDYDALDEQAKRDLARAVEPSAAHHTTNTTVTQLHEFVVEVLDPNTAEASYDAANLALGTGTTTPTSGDTALGNEVYRTGVTTTEARGEDLYTSTFIDTSEANGYSLTEVGLASNANAGSGILVNHALISDVQKDNQKAVTIDITLQFRAG